MAELFQLDPSGAKDEQLQDIVNRHVQWKLRRHPIVADHNVLLLHDSGSITRSDADRIYRGMSTCDPEKPIAL